MVESYRLFSLRVVCVDRVGPSFVRVTLGGADLVDFDFHGDDQRMNLIFLEPDADFDAFLGLSDWWGTLRAEPAGTRAPVRSYTVRAFDPAAPSVVVDFAMHGDLGPASRWAGKAQPGDRIVMCGAVRGFAVTDVAWLPPAGAARLLLAADETAVPAASSILEGLGDLRGRRVTALFEVPEPDDRIPFDVPAGVDLTWLVRSRGERLCPAVLSAAPVSGSAGGEAVVGDAAADVGAGGGCGADIWEVPEHAGGGFYAWLAGESGMVTALRRHLVNERGLDRGSIAFMGYWKRGRAQR